MTEVVRFHHVALTVSDLDRSASWYGDVLGLVELFREDGDKRRAVVFGFPSGGHAVGLVWHAEQSKPFDPRQTGLDHVAFSVDRREEPRNPAWFHNLVADPNVRLNGIPHLATVIDDDAELDRIWPLADNVFPPYATYRTRAAAASGRVIPVVRLETTER